MTTSGSSEVINKSLTRLDVADDKRNDVECPIKIAATLHARMSVTWHDVARRGWMQKIFSRFQPERD